MNCLIQIDNKKVIRPIICCIMSLQLAIRLIVSCNYLQGLKNAAIRTNNHK